MLVILHPGFESPNSKLLADDSVPAPVPDDSRALAAQAVAALQCVILITLPYKNSFVSNLNFSGANYKSLSRNL